MSTEIPDFLKKHGIKKVTDNVPEGHQVRAPHRVFSLFFSQELQKHLTRPGSSDEPVRRAK
jgi:hypothetical protein